MTEFEEALALQRSGDGFVGQLTEGWSIGGAVNGGVLMALGSKAMAGAVADAGGRGETLAFSAHFLSASHAGPVRLEPSVLRVGTNLSTAQVSLVQGDAGEATERVRMLATIGDLTAYSEPVHRQPSPPEMPPPDECIPTSMAPTELTERIKILHRLDIRLDPVTAGFGLGQPSLAGELRGWLRTVDDHVPDAAMLPFVLDAFPPVSFDLGAMGWAPTIEFTGHLRAHPEPGWLRVRLTTSTVAGGLLEEDCMVWDSTDRVVAQSRQLAGVRMPDPS